MVVRGIPADDLRALKNSTREALSLRVAHASADLPPMLGTHRIEDDSLVFVPRFRLKPGLEYRATYQPPGNETHHTQIVALPQAGASPPTRITHIYPSSNELPANLLRLYLHFSAPMSRGDSYRHMRLVENDPQHGERVVPDPFVEIDEELWDPTGTRLTILFDPGRIKQGLRPHEELGPALEAGRSYAIVIDDSWRDAAGKPLAEQFRKSFYVTVADSTQPDIDRWHVIPPRVETRQPLVIELDEPLDHAMLNRVLQVETSGGEIVSGEIAVDQEETRWQFVPTDPWPAGELQLVVDSTLEDRTGNSLQRPFEVRLDRPEDASNRSQPSVIRFQAVDGTR